MERLLQMLGILTALYAAYVLSIKKWDYPTESKRTARRTLLKTKGLSTSFYFIHARTLFLLNILSGGLFTFYWLYRQWQAICKGFRRLDETPLKHGPFIRTLCGFGTFFQLNAIICRTCEYMHQKSPLPPGVWGTLWLLGLAGTIAGTDWTMRALGYALFCGAPAVLQNRLNALPKEHIPMQPKTIEVFAAATALIAGLGLALLGRIFNS